MPRQHRTAALALALALPGCATIVTGTSQPIAVETAPAGATCTATQNGFPVGSVASTPGIVVVQKGLSDLDVTCTKPGYRTTQASVSDNFQGWFFGNILIGGLIGAGVDLGTGAAFSYEPGTFLALTPSATYHGAYAARATRSANPLVRSPSTPNGDITYVWRTASAQ